MLTQGFFKFILGFALLVSPSLGRAYPVVGPVEKSYRLHTAESFTNVLQKLLPDYTLSEEPSCQLEQRSLLSLKESPFFAYSLESSVSIIKFSIVEDSSINAFSSDYDADYGELGNIVLTKRLIEGHLESEVLAFIIAHELGHIVKKSFPVSLEDFVLTESQRRTIEQTYFSWELDADTFALRLLNTRGFDLDAALAQLQGYDVFSDDSAHGHSHPSGKSRLIALSFLKQRIYEEHLNILVSNKSTQRAS